MKLWQLLKSVFSFSGAELKRKEAASYAVPPSVTQFFNWGEFDNTAGVEKLWLADGKSVGAVYELFPQATEGQSEAYLQELAGSYAALLRDVFPRYRIKKSPWIVQCYLGDTPGFTGYRETFIEQAAKKAKQHPFTQCFLAWWERHLQEASRPGGLYPNWKDPLTSSAIQGRKRGIRLCFYRNITRGFDNKLGLTPEDELTAICDNLETECETNHIHFKRLNEREFLHWIRSFTASKPKGFSDTADFNLQSPIPMDADKPFGFDMAASCFATEPKSDVKTKTWQFDGIYQTYIPFLGLNAIPVKGALSAERRQGASHPPRYNALFDTVPEGTVFAMTMVMQDEDEMEKWVGGIERQANRSMLPEAQYTQVDVAKARECLMNGNLLMPVAMGIYVRGNDAATLTRHSNQAVARLRKAGLNPLMGHDDAVKLDSFFRFLPFNYNAVFDRRYLCRQRLLTLSQIAALFPVYGRSRGTGNFGATFFNRLTELVGFDVLWGMKHNAHALFLGTTGGGKSSLLITVVAQAFARYFPYLVLVDAGASLRYLVDLMELRGASVNRIEIKMQRPDYSLNPYAPTLKMLEQVAMVEQLHNDLLRYDDVLEKKLNIDAVIEESKRERQEVETKHNDNDKKENRDYLMEFVTASILIITGAEEKELEDLTRFDRQLILIGIKRAAKTAVEQGFSEMIPSDLRDAFLALSKEATTSGDKASTETATRYTKMAAGIDLFIGQPLNALYFNRRGNPMPVADVTWVELGLFKDDKPENEAPRALLFVTLMNNTMTLAEGRKNLGRPTIFVNDEVHITTKNKVTAASLVQTSKMGRKVDLWLWLATQHLKDFSDIARKIVTMLENLVALYANKEERDQVFAITNMGEAQQAMLHSLNKVPGKYVELLWMQNEMSYLLRSIPPKEILAIAATNANENERREALMQEYNCTPLEACLLMAQEWRGVPLDINQVRLELGTIAKGEVDNAA